MHYSVSGLVIWKIGFFTLATVLSPPAVSQSTCDTDEHLTIVSATDDGLYEETHGPENTIDENLEADSRWSNQSQGTPKTLLLNLGAQQSLKSLSIAWHKGDSRKSTFSVATSIDGTDYDIVIPKRQSGGATLDFERYPIEPVAAHYIRIVSEGNESNDWNSIVEVSASGCGEAVAKPDRLVHHYASG